MVASIVSKTLVALIVVVCGAAVLLYANQERLIFHPEALPDDYRFQFSAPVEEVYIERDGTRLHTLLFARPESKGVILYFHGNAGSLRSWGMVHEDFARVPYDLWIMDYRGFGKSGGHIAGEAMLHADALALHAAALQRYPDQEVVLYGRSIGTGVAAQLAAQHPPDLLILETPYFNFPDLVGQIAPWAPKFLLRYRLMVNEAIRNQAFPIHLIHGDRDELIPMSSSVRLAELGENIRFHRIEGAGHNTIPDTAVYRRIVSDLLAE